MEILTFSPAEVMLDITRRITSEDVIPWIVVGPLSEEQQMAGGVSIMDAGQGQPENYLPLTRPRMQLRCIGPTLTRSEQIGQHIAESFRGVDNRTVGYQASSGMGYLVHSLMGSGGPSAHKNDEGTWEYLIFIEALMGTVPIP
jgi:hypothetical protein